MPKNEAERLRALREAEVLDTPSERAYDDLTRMASAICGTPIALVSLIDEHRQWFKSKVGIEGTETPRDEAFCAHAILDEDVFVVRDARDDDRFADNPSVTGDPEVRFYAGAPIRLVGGEQVGTVCVVDRVVRDLSSEQIEALRSLAQMAATNLDLRRSRRALERESAARRAVNEQLTDLLDSANDLIQSVAPDGRILFVNRAWRETLGYSEGEIAALDLFEILAPESHDHTKALFSRLLAGAPREPLEAVFLGRDGRRIFVEGSASAKVDGSTVWPESPARSAPRAPTASVALYLRDVTDKTEAEREKQRFVATTAHEMRAPLTAVRGALSMLEDQALSKDALDLLDIAVTNTDTLLRLLQDALDLERLTAGVYSIRRIGVAVDDLVSAALSAAQKQARARAVTLDVQAEPGLYVVGERDPMVQVLRHLVSNALVRSPPARAVRLKIKAAPEKKVRFSLEDEGDTIPREVIPYIFEAPSRRPSGAYGTTSALSMALAVSKAIVLAHGGTMDVASGSPRGAVFWFELPSAGI